MEQVIKWMNRILEYVCIILLIGIIVAAVLQVFTRKVLGDSMVGTEEFARYCFIWMSFLGSSLCLTEGSHASVDLLVDRLGGKAKNIHGIILHGIVIFVCVIMIVYGFNVVQSVRRQSSPTMGVSMAYVYAACPVAAIFMIVASAGNILNSVRKIKTSEKEADQ